MPIEGGATKGRPKKQCGSTEWLKAYLANGPRLVNDIIRDAAEHTPRYSLRTLERIKPLRTCCLALHQRREILD